MISLVSPSDYPRLIAIELQSNAHPLTEKQLTDSLSSKTNRTFIIHGQDEIAGFIIIQVVIDTADIVHIVIDKSYQGKGLAKTLLTQSLTLLQEQRVLSVFLEVRENNIIAQNLYKKCGFNITGKRKNYYTNPKEDAILMIRESGLT